MELNPHIIETVTELATPEFLAKYQQAINLIQAHKPKKSEMPPLAYRLEPSLAPGEDILDASKFGGIPDLRRMYQFRRPKYKLSRIINDIWPICNCCHRPMQFLGQIINCDSFTDWYGAIHNSTFSWFTGANQKHSLEQFKHYVFSGLGNANGSCCGRRGPIRDVSPVWHIFFCDMPHYHNPNTDALVLIDGTYNFDVEERFKKVLPPEEIEKLVGKPEPLMDPEEYAKAVQAFMKKLPKPEVNGKTELQLITGFDLRFDIDTNSGDEWYDDFQFEFIEKDEQAKNIFGNDAPYQFFGQPRSQQDVRRFMCQNEWPFPHRLAPIINWTSPNDYTYQLNGCIRCSCFMEHSGEVFCKVDGSCT